MTRFLLVCLGGAVGTGARFLVGIGMSGLLGTAFPWGTLTVNVAGSFLMGAVMELGVGLGAIPPEWRLVLTVGFLGGFTTYSSYNFELLSYLQREGWQTAALYLFATAFGCLAAGLLGIGGARWLAG